MRVIGLDVHRNFAQVAILENGLVKDHGRFVMEREAALGFARRCWPRRTMSCSRPPATPQSLFGC